MTQTPLETPDVVEALSARSTPEPLEAPGESVEEVGEEAEEVDKGVVEGETLEAVVKPVQKSSGDETALSLAVTAERSV